jgi:hypothetical protein
MENWMLDRKIGKAPTKHKPTTRNKNTAMDKLERNFTHAKNIYKKGRDTSKPYLTNTGVKDGEISYPKMPLITCTYLIKEANGGYCTQDCSGTEIKKQMNAKHDMIHSC